MADDRIKSARELAMERLAGMPGMTPEEQTEQREKEHAPRGMAIAQKYLKGTIRSRDLESELEHYQGENRIAVRKGLISALCDAVVIWDGAGSTKAIDGLAAVMDKAGLTEIRQEVETIAGDFIREAEQRRAEYTEMARQKLVRMGISGSAVWPNVAEDDDWRQELKNIGAGYSENFALVKERLCRIAGI
ncbi:MAG: hypothetical protein ISS55_03725 [Dehalococcoidales bacterium]|nr:hypothetical protein [Dehalococcoidales bacterium]